LGRKSWPVTVIPTLGPPAAGSSPIVANWGVGVGEGGGGVGVGVGTGVGVGVGVGEGVGGAWGVAEAVAAGPAPAVLVAVTLKVYAVPFVRGVTVMVVVLASAVSW
jgi:hypothetical protein